MNGHALKHVTPDSPEVVVKGKGFKRRLLLFTVMFVIIVGLSANYRNSLERIRVLEEENADYITKIKETKETIETLTPEVHPAIVDWAYASAKGYVPKTEVSRITSECKKYKLYTMILSLIKEESGFDQYARSRKEAKGLGQITSAVWFDELKEAGIWESEIDAFDYRKNIAAVNYVLNAYKKQHGTWRKALTAYVNGDSAYATRVLGNFAELSLLLEEVDPQQASTLLENINAGDPTIHKELPGHRDSKSPIKEAVQDKHKKAQTSNNS